MATASVAADGSLLNFALGYLVEHKLPVFSVCGLVPHTHRDEDGIAQRCENPGKVPLVAWKTYQERLPTEAELRDQWRRYPDANIGMATGHLSGIVVLDLDGDLALRIAQARGYDNGPHVFTGRVGGQHRYFAWRENAPRNFARADGIDYRGEGGYVVLPPSRHASGPDYRFGEELGTELPELPEWVDVMAAGSRRQPVDRSSDGVFRMGERNNSLASIAGALRRQGASEAAMVAALRIINDEQCQPPLPDADVRRIAHSVARYAPEPDGSQRVRLHPERDSEEIRGFSFVSLESALDEPVELTAYLVDDMLPMAGLSLWGAKPKVGKSVAVRNLGMSVSRGEPFLGRQCLQGTVLVLALEEKRAEVINHFRQMGGTNEALHLHVGAAPNSSKEGIQALANAILLYRPVLVIVDPVFKLVRVRDSSDYAELTRELEPVIELARQTGCHIAVTHHLGKVARDGGDDVLGSTAIFGAVDTLVLMRRRKDQTRSLETIQRYGKDLTETVVPMDETGVISIGDAVSMVKISEAKVKVREVLATFVDDYWPDQPKVRELAGLAQNAVMRALFSLVEEGVVEVRGVGRSGDPYRYHLAPESRSTEPEEASEMSLLSTPYIGEYGVETFEAPPGDIQGDLPW